jgi:chromosome segregation ATPase
LDFSHNPFAP